MKSLIASGSFIEKSRGGIIRDAHTHTLSGGGSQEEQTGARGLKFTQHRRCKQEAGDGSADGSVMWEWQAGGKKKKKVDTPPETLCS